MSDGRTNLLGMTKEELSAFSQRIGEASYRGSQLYRWLYARGATSFATMTDLGKEFTAVDWEPFEISLVPVPGDFTPAIAFGAVDENHFRAAAVAHAIGTATRPVSGFLSSYAVALLIQGSPGDTAVLSWTIESAKPDVKIRFWEYFRVGLPITVMTLIVGWAWLEWVK